MVSIDVFLDVLSLAGAHSTCATCVESLRKQTDDNFIFSPVQTHARRDRIRDLEHCSFNFAFRHMSTDDTNDINGNTRRNSKRSPAPPVTKSNPYRSPFSTPLTTATAMATTNTPTSANENQSDECDTPKKVSFEHRKSCSNERLPLPWL